MLPVVTSVWHDHQTQNHRYPDIGESVFRNRIGVWDHAIVVRANVKERLNTMGPHPQPYRPARAPFRIQPKYGLVRPFHILRSANMGVSTQSGS